MDNVNLSLMHRSTMSAWCIHYVADHAFYENKGPWRGNACFSWYLGCCSLKWQREILHHFCFIPVWFFIKKKIISCICSSYSQKKLAELKPCWNGSLWVCHISLMRHLDTKVSHHKLWAQKASSVLGRIQSYFNFCGEVTLVVSLQAFVDWI